MPADRRLVWCYHYAGEILHVDQGHRLSLQLHERKDESCYVLSGKLLLTQGPSADQLAGGTSQWWDATDFARDVRCLTEVHSHLHMATVIWQIPLGNTVMRAMNNTTYHYQDNRVQTLLSGRPASRRLLTS